MTKMQKNLAIGVGVAVIAYVAYTQVKRNQAKKAIAAAASSGTPVATKDSFGSNTGSGFWSGIFG